MRLGILPHTPRTVISSHSRTMCSSAVVRVAHNSIQVGIDRRTAGLLVARHARPARADHRASFSATLLAIFSASSVTTESSATKASHLGRCVTRLDGTKPYASWVRPPLTGCLRGCGMPTRLWPTPQYAQQSAPPTRKSHNDISLVNVWLPTPADMLVLLRCCVRCKSCRSL